MNTLPLETINSMLEERRTEAAQERLAKAVKTSRTRRVRRFSKRARLHPALD